MEKQSPLQLGPHGHETEPSNWVVHHRKVFISFSCTKCGKNALVPYLIQKKRLLGGNGTRTRRDPNVIAATLEAVEWVEQEDDRLFQAVNVSRQYDLLPERIHCPHCRAVQLWSDIPKPWLHLRWFGLWVICLAASLLGTILSFLAEEFVCGGVSALLMLGLTGFHLTWVIARKRCWANVRQTQFTPPAYYNESNIHQLRVLHPELAE